MNGHIIELGLQEQGTSYRREKHTIGSASFSGVYYNNRNKTSELKIWHKTLWPLAVGELLCVKIVVLDLQTHNYL